MFWKKKNDPQVISYDQLMDRISRMEGKITRLDAEVLDLMTSQKVIRDKVLRKIRVDPEAKDENIDGFGIPFA